MNGQPPIHLPDGRPRCRFRESDEYCFEPAVYVVTVAECPLCPRYGFEVCPGHRACIEHGALARGEELSWNFGEGDADHERDVSVARIRLAETGRGSPPSPTPLRRRMSENPETTSPGTESAPDGTFPCWAILELMGHVRTAGLISEAPLFGGSLLRIDIPGKEGPEATKFYGPSAIYCIHVATEETARKVAALGLPQPVTPWELNPPSVPAYVDEEGPFDA